ncbi:MAG: carbohydrate ABC transporter permease [Spirochaetota bacterium]
MSRTPIRAGDIGIHAILIIVVLAMVLPFVHEIAKSLSSPKAVSSGLVGLWPREPTMGNYLYFYTKQINPLLRSYGTTVFITVVGTVWSLIVSSMLAFSISRPKKEFSWGILAMSVAIFSMIFTPPIVPYFLAIKSYGLMDSVWAIILPHSVVPFHLIILVTFFRELPSELIDSCRIDGAGSFTIYRRMVIPLSTAALATIAVFTAIIFWNIFLHPLLFIRTPGKEPLQIFLRSIFEGAGTEVVTTMEVDPYAQAESMKSALVVITTLPIAIVYPFLQRYFVKGMMVGAVKQ